MSTALAKVQDNGPVAVVEPPRMLAPIATPDEVLKAGETVRKLIHKALDEGRDYGKIPGTDRNTLFKAGAERIALAFGCYYGLPEIIEKEIDHNRALTYVKYGKEAQSYGLYRYVIRVPVLQRSTGEMVGSGVGSCSTTESKYISRPRDSENTVLKMAFKRAMVAACLSTFGLSDQFTQDVDDDDETVPGNHAEAAQPTPAAATDAQRAQIRMLVGTADLADDKKATWLARLDKPLSAARAEEAIAGLTKLQNPPTSSPDSAPPTSETTPAGAPATAGKKGAATMDSISKEIHDLLKSEELIEDERAEYTKMAAQARSVADLKYILGEIKAALEIADTAV